MYRLWIGILIVVSPLAFPQDDCGNWGQVTSVSSNDLESVIWSGSIFLACGNNGTIATSSNGVTWTDRNANTQEDLEGVIFGNGLFVAVGDAGTVVTSPTGSLWDAGNVGAATDLEAVAYGNGRFVTVGRDGGIFSSINGTTWNARNSTTSKHLEGVAFGNNTFVAIGDDGTVIRSENGIDWTASSPSGTLDLNEIAFGGGKFVVAANLGTVLSSEDGLSWQIDNVDGLQDLNGVGHNGNFFIIAADNGRAFVSDDGLVWDEKSDGLTGPLTDVAGNPEIIVIVSEFGAAFWSQCNGDAFGDNPRSVIPWVVDNAGFVSRFAIYNDNEFIAEATLVAVTRDGDRVEENILIPEQGLFASRAGDLFPGLTGYSLFIFANTTGLYPSILTFNIEEISGGRSPSQTTGAFVSELTDAAVFGYVPGDQIPALVVVNPEANAAPTVVRFTLYNPNGTQLASESRSLTGNQPLAILITDLFPDVTIPEDATVRATTNNGPKIAGLTFVFNQHRQPSMARAFPQP